MEKLLQQAGACAVGCVAVDILRPRMSDDGWARANRVTPGLKRLICAAFPYGPAECIPGALSLYARGADYHQVLRERLAPVAEELARRHPGCRFDFYADVSPFPEVYAAALAGLGKLGQNGLLITENAGSFVFLGFLATDAHLPVTGGEIVPCTGCGACKKACPGGALGQTVDQSRCLSALTQQRGQLTEAQAALVKQGGMLWGCDRCQLVCPENRNRRVPPLPEFAPLPDPTEEDLQLSDRAFRRQFAGRAFTWRGVQPLRRNSEILKEDAEYDHL
ncbi:MAG: epoxyqueuosine reductase [Clostridia bacterium]|nr:epoxyqueuosine reductase [Clostridia bacterium]